MWRAGLPGLLAACLALPMSGLEIDPALVPYPERIIPANVLIRNRWQSLFAIDPAWAPRQIAYLARHARGQHGTMLAARLLYTGDPWGNRGHVDAGRWRAVDRQVRIAILREIRMEPDPAWTPVLSRLCLTHADPLVVQQGLATLDVVAREAAAVLALELAVPRAQPPYPASLHGEVRAGALAQAVRLLGTGPVEVRRALAWAFAEGSAGEVHSAVRVLVPGEADALLGPALVRLDRELSGGGGSDELVAAAVAACQRLRHGDAAAAAVLARWCLDGRRELVCAAAAAAAACIEPAQAAAFPAERILERMLRPDADPAMRAAWATLLLHVRPEILLGTSDPGLAPWRRLAEHRRDQERWRARAP